MTLTYGLELPPYSTATIDALFELSVHVFGQADRGHMSWRLTHMPDLSTFTARDDSRLVGFKTGYAMSDVRYYSWLGGVDDGYRRRGVAGELMRRQHAWLAERGYASVETGTDQENRAMARVNLAHGFTVCGMRTFPDRQHVLFSKQLAPAAVTEGDR